jgi:Holliday junction DNA helicase RuvA
MIYSLRGKLIFSDNTSAAIECGGVGYSFFASTKTLANLPNKGNEAFVYTYMSVKQDGVDLFGFSSESELNMFKMLITVSNVGPKLAMSILSTFSVDELCLYIASGDAKEISRANGVGLKSAQRISLELKDKVGAGFTDSNSDIAAVKKADTGSSASKDAIAALVQFGYSQSEASVAVGKCDISKPTEDIIKQALKFLSTQL